MKRIEASPHGYATNRVVLSGWPSAPEHRHDIVAEATRQDWPTFWPMAGYTLAQTVMMKIEGVHAERDGAHDTRMSPMHTQSVY